MQGLRRTIGLNFNEHQQAVINIWAPNAKRLSVKTASSIVVLQQQPHGYWGATSNELSEGEEYWLLLDEQLLPDPTALSQPRGVHGPSMALSLGYAWTDADWCNPALEDYLIYELHTGTFSPEGDFNGIAARLDHLLELGITAIEVMPIASFPGERNWGYDGVFPFAVQHSYGGAAGLQQLVDLCHAKGLAVILDVVYNHMGPEGNYLNEFGPFFTSKYQTPWGEAINFDDAGCDGVRDFVVENVLMWFRDFHIDALRLDAVHAIRDFSARHILQEIRLQTDELMKQTGRVYYLIAECDLNDPRYISDLSKNGMGMDAQWVDEFHHALRVSAGEPRKGYYADFSGLAQLAKSFQDAYVYTGAYSEERQKRFGRAATAHPAKQFVVFSQNHDQIGNRMLAERSSALYSFEMQKLLAAAVLLSPFIPLLFMGEEWGAGSPFLYFVSHTEEELIAKVREGRKAEFAAMHLNGTAPDPQDEQTFLDSKLNWEELEGQQQQQLFKWYKQLIALRKHEELLRRPELSAVRCQVFEEQKCLLIERGLSGSKAFICCLFNFSNTRQQLAVPAHMTLIEKIADSAVGNGNTLTSFQPESFLAYSAYYV
ncbi:malto-oligosyltrehalose trehalohydrolase [Pedobacter sp. GR22-6]|uniref:malto-oligosyltrehalose trehalohydrolase n=1 Tax=Pedobacter sp. GR22-6 TaxID=3127957 RepID=UPI00307F5A92